MMPRGGSGEVASASAQTWRARVTSAVGAGHRRDGVPGQDCAVGFGPAEVAGRTMVLVAVADGHGHGRHFRSARGSCFAVRIASAVFRKHAATFATTQSAELAAVLLEDLVVPAIVEGWTARVADDLVGDPIDAARRPEVPGADDPEVFAYGSTLLVAAIVGKYALFTQIGDGDLVAVRPDGGALQPVRAGRVFDGRTTASLCLPDARQHFRTAALDLVADPLFAVFAATDGFGDAQILEEWPGPVAADLVRLAVRNGPEQLLEQVGGWAAACASSRGSGDDTSLGLLLDLSARLSAPPDDLAPAAAEAETKAAGAVATTAAVALPPALADPPTHRTDPLGGGR
jgi:hypothetical protein